MADFPQVLSGGLVVDGSGSAPVSADVVLKGDSVANVVAARSASGGDCHVIDASGLVVAPGFIDIHSHSDFHSLVCPTADSKILDGVTTEVCGNCGSSAFPLAGELLERQRKSHEQLDLEIDWHDARGYVHEATRRTYSINRVLLVGHGNLRAIAVGYDNRAPEADEARHMRTMLEDALAAGARGMSSGLIYPPGCYAEEQELADLAGIVAKANGFYATHVRNENARVETAIAEAISVAERSGVRLQISHLKSKDRENWSKLPAVLQLIEGAIERGVDVACDRYPYLAASTDLDSLLPSWAYEGGEEAELARLRDPDQRVRIAKVVAKRFPDKKLWQGVVIAQLYGAIPDSERQITDVEGKSIAEIADRESSEPVDVVFDLILQERTRVSIVHFCMKEDNLRQIYAQPYVMVGSDASVRRAEGPLSTGKPHPRAYGAFARFLSDFVQLPGRQPDGKRRVDLGKGVMMLTGLPAERIGLSDRGVLRAGCKADVTVFDPATVAPTATYDAPHSYSQGIKHVFVNGVQVVADGRHTGQTPGRIL